MDKTKGQVKSGEGGEDDWGGRRGRGKGRPLYLKNNKCKKMKSKRNQKQNLIFYSNKKNKIARNKPNQRGKRPVLRNP